MAKITPIDVIKGISGKYGSNTNDYFATNSSSNKIHLAKLSNPYTGPATEKQTTQRSKFKTWSDSANSWLNTNKPTKTAPKGTARYQQVEALKRQMALSNVRQVLYKYMDKETGDIELPDLPAQGITLTLSVSSLDEGTTNPAPGAHSYDAGESVTIQAIPETGFHFAAWSDGNSQNPRSLTLNENVSLQAAFEED